MLFIVLEIAVILLTITGLAFAVFAYMKQPSLWADFIKAAKELGNRPTRE